MNRYWDKIQNLGEHAHLRRSTLMFPPLENYALDCNACNRCGAQMYERGKDGECAECNAKEGKSCDSSPVVSSSKSTGPLAGDGFNSKSSSPTKSPSLPLESDSPESAREFRIGDTVECLPCGSFGEKRKEMIGSVLKIEEMIGEFQNERVCSFGWMHNFWPVRALKLVKGCEK